MPTETGQSPDFEVVEEMAERPSIPEQITEQATEQTGPQPAEDSNGEEGNGITVPAEAISPEQFFGNLRNDRSIPELPDPNSVMQMMRREIDFGEFSKKLANVKQEKVIIKEIVVEPQIQIHATIAKMKKLYEHEVYRILQRTNDILVSKIEEMNKVYRESILPKKFLDLVTLLDKWQIVVKPGKVTLCRFYTAPKPVTIGISEEKNEVKEYERPVCLIKAIYVNFLHSKVTRGTINLSTIGHHPNVENANFGEACVGQLDREK